MAKVYYEVGLLADESAFKLVKKEGKKGDKIPKHNHPDENILFTVVKGLVEVFIEEERFELSPGKVLSFDGNNYIHANFIEDGAFFVTLIKK